MPKSSPTTLTRRRWLGASLALGATWPLRDALACEYFTNSLRITHPWTRATPASAPYALMGIRFDEITQDEQLLAVETPVAQAVVYSPSGGAYGGAHGGIHGSTHGGALSGFGPDGVGLRNAPGSAAQDLTRPLPLDLAAGTETVLGHADLGASGPHLRLLQLTQALEIGRSYPMTLTFSKGGTVRVLLSVDYARFT